MQPAIILILGYPGTGKLTVSRELVSSFDADRAPVRLIDKEIEYGFAVCLGNDDPAAEQDILMPSFMPAPIREQAEFILSNQE